MRFLNAIVDMGSWIVFFFFLMVTVVVIIAQNSNPGDMTFPVKLGFEQTLVKAYKAVGREGGYQIELTVKRLGETEKVIATTHSNQSLNNLTNQITVTEKTILATTNPEEKKQLVNTYIATLTTASQELEKTKNQLTTTQNIPTVAAAPTAVSTAPVILATPTVAAKPTVPPMPAEPPVVTQINKTQEKIQETVSKLNKVKEDEEKEKSKKEKPEKDKESNKTDKD